MTLDELQDSWDDILSKWEGEKSPDELYSEYHELHFYAITHGFELCDNGKTWVVR